MPRRRVVEITLFSLIALGGFGALSWMNLWRRPAFTDLPVSWFERPVRGDPAAWSLPGAGEITITAKGPVRVHILTAPGQAVSISRASRGLVSTPATDGLVLTTTDGGPRCLADPPTDAERAEIRAPANLIVRVVGPVFLEIDAAETLMLDLQGCTHVRVASADHLSLAGKGQVDVEAAHVDRGLDAILRGPGRLRVGSLTGTLDAETWVGGRIDISGGHVAPVLLFAKGGGHIFSRGQAANVTAETRLRAKIRIAETLGVVSADGDVEVGRPGARLSGF